MALCDDLEDRQNQHTETHTQLIRAAHQPLTQAGDPAEFQTAWLRVHDHFDRLYSTIDSVKALRQTILQLAVQGKLVSQDPNDEPARVLLEKIKLEKERLVAEGKARKQKVLAPFEPDKVPFELPAGWQWTNFDCLVNVVGGVTKGRKLAGRKTALYPYLRVANVQRAYLDLRVIKEIEVPVDELDKYRLRSGDLLITEGGDWDKVGRTAIWLGEIEICLHQNHVFRARVVGGYMDRVWLMAYLNSPLSRDYFAGSSKQTTNLASINMTQLRSAPIPVPPLREQHRVVKRIDELMSLCDELEAKVKVQQTTAGQFAEAVVAELAA
jgi:type I restriction enzyme S subunit